jgi:hypothetical protein
MRKIMTLIACSLCILAKSQGIVGKDGDFYNSLEDWQAKKPSSEYKIKSGSQSFNWGGESFKLIDKNGNGDKENLSKAPSILFTYCPENDNVLYLYRIFEGYSYSVILTGNICVYTFRKTTGNGGQKDVLYYSEGGIKGDLKKFSENVLEDWLTKANLLETYKNDKPKREAKDNVSDYYNKVVGRYIKYIDMLNKK